MARIDEESVLVELEASVGDALRYVARYDLEGLEPLYVRKDVADGRDEAVFNRLHEELIYQDVSSEHVEGALESGELLSTMQSFETLLLFNLIDGENTGVVVTTDRAVDVPLSEFLSRVERR